MKFLIILLFAVFTMSIHGMAQFNFTFPTQWTKDFRVEALSKGGSLDHKTSIRFTHDSCVYVNRIQGTTKKNSFMLTEKQRTEILGKLKQLKSDSIGSVHVALDKSTTSIVLYNVDGVFSASDDTDNEEVRRVYHEVFNYLVEFASTKKKKDKSKS